MQTVPYWPFDDAFSYKPMRDSTGGPMDQSAVFQPDVGPPITRRRTTANVEMWQMGVLLETFEKFAEFETWFQDDLAGGNKPFSWRHPLRRDVRSMKFAPAQYQQTARGGEWIVVSFSLVMLPGVPFYAPYVPETSARAPDWVADYTAGKFWKGSEQVTASALSTAISGDYKVLEQRADGQLWRFATYSADLPSTAPAGVTWLAGFVA